MARLEVENYDKTVTIAEPHEDLTANDWIEMFYGAMVSITFIPRTVLEAMRDYAEERLELMTEDENDETMHD